MPRPASALIVVFIAQEKHVSDMCTSGVRGYVSCTRLRVCVCVCVLCICIFVLLYTLARVLAEMKERKRKRFPFDSRTAVWLVLSLRRAGRARPPRPAKRYLPELNLITLYTVSK